MLGAVLRKRCYAIIMTYFLQINRMSIDAIDKHIVQLSQCLFPQNEGTIVAERAFQSNRYVVMSIRVVLLKLEV